MAQTNDISKIFESGVKKARKTARSGGGKSEQTQETAESSSQSSFTGGIQKQIDSHDKQLEKMFNFVLLGFALLLVMVATMVLMVGFDYKHSADELHNEQYQFLKERIDALTTPIPTPTNTLTPVLPTITPAPVRNSQQIRQE